MEYIDPIETARKILAGEPISEETEVDTVDTPDLEELEALVDSFDPDEDEDLELEDDVEVDEAYMTSKKHHGKVKEDDMPPQFKKKKNGKEDEEDDDDDEEEDEKKEAMHHKAKKEMYGKMNAMKNTKKEGVVDPKSEEDPDLYKDSEGKGAKVAKPTGNTSGKNKGSIKTKPSAAGVEKKLVIPASEHIEVLFSGEELSEDFKNKATTVFEAAINEHVSAVEETLREEHEQAIAEHTEQLSNELSQKLDDYLSYVVEQWMSENELAIESGIKNDIAENFLVGLRDLFERHYVDLPEENANILEAMAEEVISMQGKLENEMESNITLRKELSNLKCEEILTDVSEDLVDTDAEKLKTLAEGLEFESVEQYKEKVELLKDNYFSENVTAIEEETSVDGDTPIDNGSSMGIYAQALTKLNKVDKSNQLS